MPIAIQRPSPTDPLIDPLAAPSHHSTNAKNNQRTASGRSAVIIT